MIMFQKMTTSILDAVYPAACISCGSTGRWWCESCRAEVERPAHHPCTRCLSTERGHDKRDCGGLLPFSGIITIGFYHAKPLRRLITELKYNGVTALHQEVERFLLDRASEPGFEFPWETNDDSITAIQPVPLAPHRLRDRGFNQSQSIAERIRAAWLPNISIFNVLERITGGPAQASLDHKLRGANIRGAFLAREHVQGTILLIDDVVTTGGTAGEAARCLLGAGASSVYLATIAIGA